MVDLCCGLRFVRDLGDTHRPFLDVFHAPVPFCRFGIVGFVDSDLFFFGNVCGSGLNCVLCCVVLFLFLSKTTARCSVFFFLSETWMILVSWFCF